MHSLTSHVLFATAALSSVASGHLILTKPTPFIFQNPDYKRSPLLPDGSDYPCKKVNNQPLQSQGSNPISVGQTYNLEWDNYVTHGGGSCQLSVTRDLDPTKSSVFKVIKTWEGGCPMTSEGNNWAAPLPWQMPSEVQNGDAVLAWTWIPRLSLNEEIYMNCAAITVSGGAQDDSAFNQLPDLFLPNLQSSSCHAPLDGKALVVPNAGKYAQVDGGAYGLSEGKGNGCGAGQAPKQPAPAPTPAPAPAPAPPQPPKNEPTTTSQVAPIAPSPAPGGSDNVDIGPNRGFNGGSAGQAASSSPQEAAPPAPAAPQQPAPQAAGTVSTGAVPIAAPASGTDANQTCPVDGKIVCGSEREFALCNFGKVGQWSRTADGTVCRDGEIKVSDDYVGKSRRSIGGGKLRRHLAAHKRHHARSLASQ